MSSIRLVQDEPKLEEILLDEDIPQEKEGFRVNSLESASWAARKYLEAKARIDERIKQNEEFKTRIDSWFERSSRDDIRTVDYMATIIKPYAKAVLDKQKRGKTLNLPNAVISFRTSSESVSINDEVLLIDFCESNHPELLETKKTVKKKELKSLFKNGEILPGAELVTGSESMTIKEVVKS